MVKYTNGIPQCPYCNKPTKRTAGMITCTALFFQPMYDKNGVNINPDRNTRTQGWRCCECEKNYAVIGNDHDGYKYKLMES